MKIFKTVFILFLLLLIAGYLVSGFVFETAAKKALPLLVQRLADQGIQVNDYNFEKIRFSSLRTISAKNVRAEMNLSRGVSKESYTASFYAEKINLHITSVFHPAARISGDNFRLSVEKADDIPGTSFGRFEHGYIQFREPIYLANPRKGLHTILQNLSDLFREKDVMPNVILRAQITFKVRDRESQAWLYTKRENGQATLRFEAKDIRQMADVFDLELSDDEVSIIARYPVRASIIMRITSYAKETSRSAHRRNRNVPEDAYRHVLWSFLLTQKFGETFAERVTDAHEVLPTNTAAERQMDFHNNSIGRLYAARGEKRDHIMWLVMNDRRVIKTPQGATM